MPIIPDSLMARLQQANEQFRQARQRMDKTEWVDKDERTQVGTALRAAEQELEDVTRQIHDLLASEANPGPDTPPADQRPGQ
jgi:hypothetical protein